MSSRTEVGEVGASWVRRVTSGSAERWLAAVWVRDLDGRRRLVKARRPGRREAELALEERLALRRPLGFRGPSRTRLCRIWGEYWMRRRLEEARAPATGERRGADEAGVSLQTLAGYQSALSRITNPRLGGLRLIGARTGVVVEALARVDLSGRTTRVARSVLAKALQSYVNSGRRIGGPSRRSRSAATSSASGNAAAIRACANENGIELSARGRIPAGVVEQYEAAN